MEDFYRTFEKLYRAPEGSTIRLANNAIPESVVIKHTAIWRKDERVLTTTLQPKGREAETYPVSEIIVEGSDLIDIILVEEKVDGK